VRVELTTRLAESRIAGFEGREGHRTPFASAKKYSGWPELRKAVQSAQSKTRSILEKSEINERRIREQARKLA